MKPLVQYLEHSPIFAFLLVIFYVFHGYVDYYPIVPLKDAAWLFIFYTGIIILLSILCYLFFRNWLKAFTFAFLILFIQFFFGPFYDFLEGSGSLHFLAKYSVLLPLILIVLVTAFIMLKKKDAVKIPVYFLNILFLVLVVVDVASLVLKNKNQQKVVLENKQLSTCNDCPKPDIYLLLADGYAGKKEQLDLLNFDNSLFEQQLAQRNFFIADSSYSNYNFTYFSIASMLNMDYLNGIKGKNSDKNDQAACNKAIRKNMLARFLRAMGYKVYNNSIFDMEGAPSVTATSFLPVGSSLVTRQTLTSRMLRDLGYHLVTTFRISYFMQKQLYLDRDNNKKVYNATIKAAKSKSNRPKFVFTHLMMPHYPYYFDSTGKPNPAAMLTEGAAFNKDLYLSYLKYANTRILELIDTIRKAGPAIIIFMSDHGFREWAVQPESSYLFNNMVAISTAGGNRAGYYPGMTSLNFFRNLLNNEFRQKLPLLKDSSILIRE